MVNDYSVKEPLLESADAWGHALSAAVLRFHEEIARALDLNVSEHKALDVILYSPEPTAGRIGAELGLSAAAATKIVNSLLARGYITRERDPQDGRRYRLTATAAIAETMSRIYEPLTRRMREFAENAPPEVVVGVGNAFAAMLTGLDESHAALSAPGLTGR
ncbi:winged helix-turn-helix transcriptional regulator [Microbacterium lushaniae]|nr:winged helix-turn-helix transcriptional regulator [Microbacterium lushaniae]KAA9159524.1 winged helix-turn-helix transcriptional regulator [Microbacterium lushaniae]